MPLVRKRRFEREENEPATQTVHIFHLPGHKADVKLSVFDGLEIHAHSVLLKLHSAFFRRFLDLQMYNKDGKGENTGVFKYEWATVYDDDGSWSLFDARNIKHNSPNSNWMSRKLRDTREAHELAFINFIGTFYGKSWAIKDTEALQLVTELADYYCALPVVSKSMHGSLFLGPVFCKSIFYSPTRTLLDLALQLYSHELFRECMICLVGKWQHSAYQHPIESQSEISYNPKLTSPKLNELAIKLHNQICTKVFTTQQQIEFYSQINPNALEVKGHIEICFLEKMELRETEHGANHRRVSLPEYFQAFKEESSGVLALAVSDILKNELVFNKSLRAGDIVFPGDIRNDILPHFLCVEIKDEDLSWDSNETDW
ncbi:hypothetical protein BOTCAL_0804g00020 [Botryotinia calthae]|uniref:BTB domain-containing protein n=1 Tax=Botryotinia calthae TaxID=38488 RepID=A0A4Y8CFZ4_9HELO|nr:hypothetical protein BOTCAL_0804g00020 [Botryotinia calthae]